MPPGKATPLSGSSAPAFARSLPLGEVGTRAFALLAGLAARSERITYADFAFELGLGSPRRLGWLLTPLYDWCRAEGRPPLPIIVVRRADGLPSGGYDPASIETETGRVFAFDWVSIAPPSADDLIRFALPPSPPAALRGRNAAPEPASC